MKTNRLLRSGLVLMAFGILAMPFLVSAAVDPISISEPPATGGDNSNGAVSNSTTVGTPPTGGDDANGAVSNSTDITPPQTAGDDTTGAVSNSTSTTTPPTAGDTTNGAQGTTTDPVNVPPQGGDNVTGAQTGGNNQNTDNSTPQAQTSNQQGNGGGSTGGGAVQPLVTLPPALPQVEGTSTTACPYITKYMRYGIANDPAEVTKLQIFLNDHEHNFLNENGYFDRTTENAVKSFQATNPGPILGPWSVTTPTGVVGITTRAKINAVMCGSPLSLNPTDLSIINGYKAYHAKTSAAPVVAVQGIPSTSTVLSDNGIGPISVAITSEYSTITDSSLGFNQ